MSKFERKNSARPLLSNNSSYLGTIAYKESFDQSNKRYLWIDYLNKELRWSVKAIPQGPCKKLRFSHIQSISKVPSSTHFGFKIQSNSHDLVFWLLTEKELKTWINEISNFISPNENIKNDRMRATSLIAPECADKQHLKIKSKQVLNPHISNTQYQHKEDISITIKDNLENIISHDQLEEEIDPEIKSLQDQVSFLQNKIKSMEEVKLQYDSYLTLEEEYKFLQDVRTELNIKLDKISSETNNHLLQSQLLTNELNTILIWNKQFQGKNDTFKVVTEQVTVNNEAKFASLLFELSILYIYHTSELTPDIDKIIFSMIKSIQVIEDCMISILLINGSSLVIVGNKEFLIKIIRSFEKYQEIQADSNEKELNYYSLLCNDNEKQLRMIEKQVKSYKKAVTVIIS